MLVKDLIAQRGGDGFLLGAEELQVRWHAEPGHDHPGRDRVPVRRLARHVEGGKPAASAGTWHATHFSRRRTAASRPMPPTMVTSNGASNGGPISML